MPIYPYRCETCGRSQDQFNRIAERDSSAPLCCGQQAARQLSAPMVFVPGNLGYKCPVTGQLVTSERQRRNLMSEHRLVDANDFTPAYQIERKRKAREENNRLAAELYKDIPKEVVAQATALAHEPA